MSRPTFVRIACVVALACARLHAQHSPVLEGYVTRVGTPQAFEVNGLHVACATSTIVGVKASSGPKTIDFGCRPRIYGEHLVIYGKRDKKAGTIAATEIDSTDATANQTIQGVAIIDKVLSPELLRADGFALQVTPATELHWESPLSTSSKPAVNQWIEYKAKRDDKGVLVASYLGFYASTVTPEEQKLRDKNEFDPAAVSDDDKQHGASKFFKGVDYKRIPAVHDAVQQERVERIGKRLIPAYQNKLVAGDPDKLNFRFQLVDSKWAYCITLPNGIILVPAYLAADLKDDELAAVLAYYIAGALEKQVYRSIPAGNAMAASNVIGSAAGLIVPGLGLGTLVGTGVASSKLEVRRQQQSARISLVLLHDAGFDLREAPIAWWRVSSARPSRDPDDFMQRPAPRVAAYLFQTLATTWNPSSPLLGSVQTVTPAQPIQELMPPHI